MDNFKHRWINSKIELKTSKIHGFKVLVAKSDIPKEEVVLVIGGIIVPKKDIKNYRKKLGHVGIPINKDFFICPASKSEVKGMGILNHSCSPNVSHKDVLTFRSNERIKKDEELTIDYSLGDSDFENFKCVCGSKNCRRIIKGKNKY